MKNELVKEILRQIADLLEIKGENIYKIRAYRKAIDNLNQIAEDIEVIVAEGRVKEIPGIGNAIGDKIVEIVKTGQLGYLEKLKKQIPIEVTTLMRVEGIGGKTAGRLYKELGITSLEDLEEAIEEETIYKLSGFTENKVGKIKRAINYIKSERTPLPFIEPIALRIKEQLETIKELAAIEIGGSIRRRKSTIRDIDLHGIAKEEHFEKIMDYFSTMNLVVDVIVKGKLKTTVKLENGVNVDLRLLEPKSYGSGYLHSTGSKAHTIGLRTLAEKKRLLLNEYGLFLDDESKLLASKTEEEVYKKLELALIPPELREGKGEIEAAKSKNLPDLVVPNDLKSDLHIHTSFSDGKATIEMMAKGAEKRGLEYIIITDHVGKIGIYNPVTEEKFFQQKKEIEKLQENVKVQILHGIEVDINSEGELDAPKEILENSQFTIGSIHSNFNIPEKKMTERMLKAMDNEYLNAIGHPTGRMFGKRPGYKINFSKIADKASETKIALEINAQPNRLDVDDFIVYDFKDKIDFYIGTDAHYVENLDFLEWGINIARRAWCTKNNLLNTLSVNDFLKKTKK